MKWVRRLAVLTVAFALAACATSARYEAALNSWLGQPESALVGSWGPPQSVYQAPDGMRILSYSRQGNMYLPGTAPTYQSTVIGNTVYTTPVGGTAAVNIPLSCMTNITIKDGHVSSWTYQGNNCISR